MGQAAQVGGRVQIVPGRQMEDGQAEGIGLCQRLGQDALGTPAMPSNRAGCGAADRSRSSRRLRRGRARRHNRGGRPGRRADRQRQVRAVRAQNKAWGGDAGHTRAQVAAALLYPGDAGGGERFQQGAVAGKVDGDGRPQPGGLPQRVTDKGGGKAGGIVPARARRVLTCPGTGALANTASVTSAGVKSGGIENSIAACAAGCQALQTFC